MSQPHITICVLENSGLNPIENKKIFYGIFDFGNGTTDFDFGLYRCFDEETEDRYDYLIEQFCSEGDKFLGGENLLELLSFEIFKANQHNLRYKSNEVISSIPAGKEIRFNYYVGRAKRGAFKVILDRNIEYGK